MLDNPNPLCYNDRRKQEEKATNLSQAHNLMK
jgi:hypothetical protein